MRYRCDVCGRYLYLDPAERRLCDECKEKIQRQSKAANWMRETIRESENGQYEMKLHTA